MRQLVSFADGIPPAGARLPQTRAFAIFRTPKVSLGTNSPQVSRRQPQQAAFEKGAAMASACSSKHGGKGQAACRQHGAQNRTHFCIHYPILYVLCSYHGQWLTRMRSFVPAVPTTSSTQHTSRSCGHSLGYHTCSSRKSLKTGMYGGYIWVPAKMCCFKEA